MQSLWGSDPGSDAITLVYQVQEMASNSKKWNWVLQRKGKEKRKKKKKEKISHLNDKSDPVIQRYCPSLVRGLE